MDPGNPGNPGMIGVNAADAAVLSLAGAVDRQGHCAVVSAALLVVF